MPRALWSSNRLQRTSTAIVTNIFWYCPIRHIQSQSCWFADSSAKHVSCLPLSPPSQPSEAYVDWDILCGLGQTMPAQIICVIYFSGHTGPVEGAAFITPAGIKRPQHVQHGHSRLSSPRGKALPGHSSGATDTLVINPKAGLQSRHVGLATAVAAGNVTFYSNSSGD